MKLWSQYIVARSIPDALLALSASPGPACPISGGTDLLLEIQQGRRPPYHTLVDITEIPALHTLDEQDGCLVIGASVPVAQIAESPLVREHALALAQACALIGGPQVRNTATLGGNVAHGLPAADGMIALVALNALAEIAGPGGTRLAPVQSLYLGPGKTALRLDQELIVSFRFPLRYPGQASSFSRVMRPQGVALPILNMAIWLDRWGDRMKDIRIAVGPAGPVPQRACGLEEALLGRSPDAETLEMARNRLRESLTFRTSPMRASAAYRYELCEVLLEEVLAAAWNQALDEV